MSRLLQLFDGLRRTAELRGIAARAPSHDDRLGSRRIAFCVFRPDLREQDGRLTIRASRGDGRTLIRSRCLGRLFFDAQNMLFECFLLFGRPLGLGLRRDDLDLRFDFRVGDSRPEPTFFASSSLLACSAAIWSAVSAVSTTSRCG